MSEEKHKHISVSIEAAMERVAKDAKESITFARSNRPRSVGRREYDKAPSRRLAQLHHAMGIDETQEAPPAKSPPLVTETARKNGFLPSTLILTGLISGLTGAGAMWLAMGTATALQSAAATPTMPPMIVTSTPAPAPVLPPPEVAPATVKSAESLARELVENWRTAWTKRDVEAYLSFYSPTFKPGNGSTRADWAAARRKNLESRTDIQVAVRELEITQIADNRLTASFQQDYASGNYRENSQSKTLVLSLNQGKWQISEERSDTPALEKKPGS